MDGRELTVSAETLRTSTLTKYWSYLVIWNRAVNWTAEKEWRMYLISGTGLALIGTALWSTLRSVNQEIEKDMQNE